MQGYAPSLALYRGIPLVLFLVLPIAGSAAEHVNPHQPAIDELNDKKALLKAESDLLEAQAALIKNEFPALPNGLGKTGQLTVETSERDKFHISARAAESFALAAEQIATAVKDDCKEGAVCVLMTDMDRAALLTYWDERGALERIGRGVESLLGKLKPKATIEAAPPLIALGAVLLQAAQLSQIVRTDKSLAFGEATIPDDLLFDQVACLLPKQILYPTGAMEGIISGNVTPEFRKNLEAVLSRRAELVAAGADNKKKEKADALMKQIDELAARLTTVDAKTKRPVLLSVLLGEVVEGHLTTSSGRSLLLRVISQGGSSLKTTSIWRSDRLYAAGGVVVSYRVADGDSAGTVRKAGVAIAETPFKRVPLD